MYGNLSHCLGSDHEIIRYQPQRPSKAAVLGAGVEACDTVQHHQIQPQKFAFNKTTSQLECVDPKCKGRLCVTTGRDDEPVSRTLAIEMAR
jgi:hypothetical protein